MVKDTNKADFKADTASGTVVVDFWAPWCGPCKMVAPVVEAAAASNTSVKFLKVNVDDEPELAAQFGVRGIPTLVLLENGVPVRTKVGALNQAQLQALIAG